MRAHARACQSDKNLKNAQKPCKSDTKSERAERELDPLRRRTCASTPDAGTSYAQLNRNASAALRYNSVSHNGDQPRFLARVGYATHPTGVDPLECLRPDEQQRMSSAARDGERRRRLEAARQTREHVSRAVDEFESSGHLPPKLRSSARAVRRSADALVRNAERTL